jgi:hypothetical protein
MSRAGDIKAVALEVDGLLDEINQTIAAIRALGDQPETSKGAAL